MKAWSKLLHRHFALVLFLAMVSSVFALGGPEESDAGFWAGRIAPVTLESPEAEAAFSDELLRNFSFDPDRQDNPVVEVIHLKGQRMSPYLETTLQKLSQAGFEIKGSYVGEEEFAQKERELPIAYRVRYTEDSARDLRAIKSRVFGLPEGFTVFAHFFKRGLRGKFGLPKFRFPFDREVFTFAAEATTVVALNNLVVRYLGNWLLGKPFPSEAEIGASSCFLSLWVFTFLNLRREFMSMKSQGRRVIQDPNAPPGMQIRVVANRNLFTLANLVQDQIFIGSLTAILYAFGTVEIHDFAGLMATLVNVALTGTASALAYTNFDAVIADMNARAEKLRHTDPVESHRIRKEIRSWSRYFYCGLLPLTRNIALFLQGPLKQVPLVALAGAGWAWKISQEGFQKGPEGDVLPTPEHLNCSALISFAR